MGFFNLTAVSKIISEKRTAIAYRFVGTLTRNR